MAKAVKTVFSKRVRKENLSNATIENIDEILKIQNLAKIKAYSYLAYNKEDIAINESGSLHLHIKNIFGLSTYYTNYAVTEAKWVYNSNKEVNNYHISNLKDVIKHKNDYLKKQKKKLVFWNKIKKYMVNTAMDIKKGKNPKLKTFSVYKFFIENESLKVECRYKNEIRVYDFYLFEMQVVNKKLKILNNKINFIKRGIEIKEIKLKSLKTNIPKSVFGSKKLFKAQFTTYKDNIEEWKEQFIFNRHKAIQLQGVKVAEQGNCCVRYNVNNKTLSLAMPYQNIQEGKKYHTNVFFDIPNVEFTYHKELYFEALDTMGSTISYRLEDHGTYYIIKATFDVEVEDKYINYSKANGVIGYDINFDHIAYAETDGIGNILSSGTIPFDIEKKSSCQIDKILEEKAKELVSIAKKCNKPIVGEDISKIKNNTASYGNKKRNRHISLFAHRKIITAIKSRAFKEMLDVSYVNPAYTSKIGKLKYMKTKGLSVHTSAAFVIARRGMKYREKLKSYKKENLDWKKLSYEFKDIWTHWLYNVPNIKEYSNIKEYIVMIKKLNWKETKINFETKIYEHKFRKLNLI